MSVTIFGCLFICCYFIFFLTSFFSCRMDGIQYGHTVILQVGVIVSQFLLGSFCQKQEIQIPSWYLGWLISIFFMHDQSYWFKILCLFIEYYHLWKYALLTSLGTVLQGTSWSTITGRYHNTASSTEKVQWLFKVICRCKFLPFYLHHSVLVFPP